MEESTDERIEKLRKFLRKEPLYFGEDFKTVFDKDDKKLDIRPIGYSVIIQAKRKPLMREDKYILTLDGHGELLTSDEVICLLSGIIDEPFNNWADTEAHIEASQRGPGIADSYLLGTRHLFPEMQGYVSIPVQYFKILKRHNV